MDYTTLREYLHYDPYSGVFTWVKKPHRSRIVVGSNAGTPDCKDGYLRVQLLNKSYRIHRLAFLYMTGKMPEKLVDHKNGIRTDNRWVNLREADHTQNVRNTAIAKNNTLGVKGVYKSGNCWIARAMVNKQFHYLGCFKTIEAAAKAYIDFTAMVHREYHYLRRSEAQ